MATKKETLQFKTEVNQLLDLMIHSLYSHKEIFLRELISNSSDAVDKLRFDSVTNEKLLEKVEGDFKIKIIPDKKKNTLTIQDNGIGMNHDELIDNIGTIAKSGTKEFFEKLKKVKDSEVEGLIGQFGVGFYSAFMVADKIVVNTQKAGEKKAFCWESEGKGTFSLEETKKNTTGTEIILFLKKDETNFLEEWKIRELVKKYSDFIPYPIVMDVEKEEEVAESEDKKDAKDKKDTKDKKETKKKKVITEEKLNSEKALWTKNKSEIKEEEYHEFYKYLTNDTEKPLLFIHQQLEGLTELKLLVYIPQKANFDLYHPDLKYGINLYVKRVFIMDNCEELIPQYLRFVKGVVDSSDLPLNVSREILQSSPRLSKIKKTLTKKVLKTLSDLKEKDNEKYLTFYKAFGKVLKEGTQSDFENKEILQDLLLFESTMTKPGELISLKEYTKRMASDQKAIYFITGESRDKVENSPHLELFKKKGYEVLFLTDPIDEWVSLSIFEYDKKPFQSILKDKLEVEENKEEQKKEEEKKEKKFSDFLILVKETLKDEIKEVTISKRLVDSPACIVSDSQGMSSNMERILNSMNKEVPKARKIFEINIDHPVFKKLTKQFKTSPKSSDITDYIKVLYDQALLAEGSEVKDRSFLVKKITELMEKGL